MIQKLIGSKIKPLSRISPSQYHSAISCPYKLVLANSFGYQPLMPLNANAYFGSIIHKMIELISTGVINDEQTFSENWINLIGKKEEELRGRGLAGITPLKYFVTDFALKKNQIKTILQKKQEKIKTTPKATSNRIFSEKRLENLDKSVTGIVDLIIENDFGATILDFKTGKIYSDAIDENGATEQIIKEEYKVQLRLYAHLYFLMNNRYPKSLYLVTLSNNYIEVNFEPAVCKALYDDALRFLSTTNNFISRNDLKAMAHPSVENCKYCSYRPACSFYSEWVSINFEAVNDLFGIIKKVNLFNNGSIGLELVTNDKQVLINGLTLEMKEKLELLVGKKITLYNLKKTKQSLNATANSFTTVYE